MLRRLFIEHPASVGESYMQHMRVAAGFGLSMLLGAGACFAHAIVPAIFKRTGSGTVKRLHARLHHDPAREGRLPEYII